MSLPGTIKCRVIRAYGFYSVGFEFWPSTMLRGELIRRGFIEPVESDVAPGPTAMVRPLPEVPMKRKRGRPRKHPVEA